MSYVGSSSVREGLLCSAALHALVSTTHYLYPEIANEGAVVMATPNNMIYNYWYHPSIRPLPLLKVAERLRNTYALLKFTAAVPALPN